ncbi:MAG: hypothetical protein EKK51_14120 [Mycolicibacterium sp.]|uniref:DUF7427 family protein n=1 Tax=Mycolicibacterium sp. TaxID=2320850 RepID=UPI000F96C424|nr:hypothetical protein [Mycolicibacterium sp.]RUP31506.1 MAG: hypothetical protein EKK51_14120 [Mycolicibacterium sp.]TXH23285.1 MAG: hypothetical protein E6R06_15305 [Mycobacterium sp.]
MNRIRTLRTAGSSDFPQWRLTMNAKQAWAVLTAVVLSYEIACREGQLLSEGVDEWLISRPILTRAAIAAMALHLGNALPKRYDIVSLGFQALRQSSRYLLLVSARLAS